MSINTERGSATTVTPGWVNSRGVRIPADFGVVCLWSFLGLDLAVLMIALGFGAEIAEVLSIAG